MKTDSRQCGLASVKPANILVVDDDPALRALVRDFLRQQGHVVYEAENADAMRQVLEESEIDILILDVMMPGEDGLSIARSLIDEPDIGIIMVSALGSETDRIIGLEMGADDYLAKPISPRELLARIHVFQRRWKQQPRTGSRTGHFEFQGWQLDPLRRVLRDPAGVRIGLSEREFTLLLALVEAPNTVLSRDHLLDLLHDGEVDTFDRAVDSQVSRLRRKLSERGGGQLVATVRREGYMFMPSVRRL